jgi:hypothetical protein
MSDIKLGELSIIDKIIEKNEHKLDEKTDDKILLGKIEEVINLDEKNMTLYCTKCKKEKSTSEYDLTKAGKYYKACRECRSNKLPETKIVKKVEEVKINKIPNILQQQDIAAKMVKELNKVEKKDIDKMKEVILKYDKSITKDMLDVMTDDQIIQKRDAIASEQISIALNSSTEEILFMGIKMVSGIIECLPQLKEKEIYLDGFTEAIERNKNANIAIIKEICKKNPEMLAKLTPEYQLGLSLIGTAVSVATQNKLKMSKIKNS